MRQRPCTFGAHDGPIFPDAVTRLNSLYGYGCPSDDALASLARDPRNGVRNFQYVQHLPAALDGTQWYAGMQFKCGNGSVFVTFPFHQEAADVSIAVYARDAGTPEIEAVMQDLENMLMVLAHAD